MNEKYIIGLTVMTRVMNWYAKALQDGKVDAQEWGELTHHILQSLQDLGVDVELDVES